MCIKQILSYVLIFSLVAPDVGRCMMDENSAPPKRVKSAPPHLKPPLRETRARSSSFGDPSQPMMISPRFFQPKQECSAILPSAERDEKALDATEIILTLGQGLSDIPLDDSDKKDGISPPTSATRSSNSSSPSKESQSNPTSSDTPTRSLSTDSLTDLLFDQPEEKEPNVESPLTNFLRDDEKLLQEEGNKTLPPPLIALIDLLQEDKDPGQLIEKITESKKAPLVDKDMIILTKAETNSSEPLPIVGSINPRSLPKFSPSDNGQQSTSRRNSDSSGEDRGATHQTEVITNSLIDAIALKLMEGKENVQVAPSSSGDESSSTYDAAKSSSFSSEDLDSPRVSLESQQEKQVSTPSNRETEEKEPVLLGAVPEQTEVLVTNNTEKKKDSVGDTVLPFFDKPEDRGEKTSLLLNNRPHQYGQKPQEKKNDITKDWEKLGTTSDDDITFHHKNGDQIRFEGDIEVIPKRKKDTARSGDEWVLLFENPGSGHSARSYELLSSINGDDPENRRGGPFGEVEEICSKTRAFLLHVNYLIEGKPTWRQFILGGIGGGLIGLGVGNAMPVIFINSLYDLGPTYLDIITNNDLVARLFISHTAITLGVDSISRNVGILGELTAPSLEEFSVPKSEKMKWNRWALLVAMYTGTGIAALLPVYYLWDAEEVGIKKHPEERSIRLTFFSSLASSLWFDLGFMISCSIKNWIDKKFNDICINQIYEYFQNIIAKAIRQQNLDQFEELITIFSNMDDRETRKAYTQLFLSENYTKKLAAEYGKMSYGQTFKRAFSNQDTPPIEQIKITESQRILKILNQIYKAHPHNSEPMEEETENERPTVATLLSWGTPLLATPARGFILWYTIDSMLGSLGMPWSTERVLLSNFAGQIVASFFQGVIELDKVSKALSNLDKVRKTLSDREKSSKVLSDIFFPEDERADHPCLKTCNILGRTLRESCKVLGNTYLYAQGAWNTLPYLLVGAKATRFWPSWARGLTLVPFGIADMFNNTISFQESYVGAYNFMRRLTYTYVLNPTPQYMRERLVAVAQELYNLYQQPLDPAVVREEAKLSGKSLVIDGPESL